MSRALSECQRQKAQWRTQIRTRRRALTQAWVDSASSAIAARVLALPEFRQIGTLCGYTARADEVQTDAILCAAWAAGKRVGVPAWSEAEQAYRPAWLTAADRMIIGRFGIGEPANARWVEEPRLDLVLVPGLAFDADGRRLGHGKGYYDRMLVRPVLASAFKVGLAFEFQIMAKVPVSVCDIPVDIVITEMTQYVAQTRRRQ
jgi:5-formyltetrahydrofolate cyclo-ligase